MGVALQAVIFDVDGTLADTERSGHRRAFNRAFAAAGLEWVWSAESYGELLRITGGKERIRRYLEEEHPDAQVDGDTDGFIAGLHLAKNRIYEKMVAAGDVPLRPGVKRLLLEARSAGLRLAIATSTSMDSVLALLQHGVGPAAQDWFEVIAAGDMATAKKPSPDIHLLALKALRLPPEQCMALEDSGSGLHAALAARLPTLVTINDYTARDDFDGAIAVVDHLGEPDLPMHVLAGDLGGAAYVDVAALRYAHAQRSRGRPARR